MRKIYYKFEEALPGMHVEANMALLLKYEYEESFRKDCIAGLIVSRREDNSLKLSFADGRPVANGSRGHFWSLTKNSSNKVELKFYHLVAPDPVKSRMRLIMEDHEEVH